MKIQKILEKGLEAIESSHTLEDLEQVRIDFLSRKGTLSLQMREMKNLDPKERPIFGKAVNDAKRKMETALETRLTKLKNQALHEKMKAEAIDVSMPAVSIDYGYQNPLILMIREMEDSFREMGYEIIEGDELELDLYNFEKANIPKDHPAREMQDTFFIDEHHLLRTHTTAIQTRALEAKAPELPLKAVCPGKVYRRDEDDATHSHQFMQLEGIVVAHGITLSDLKGTLSLFAKKMFGDEHTIRFRPSYFQFTEPSVEIDVSCHVCSGKGCSVCSNTGWIEILGGGMVHPKVLKDAGYEDETLTGFAFGVGVERIAMLKYGIEDIRQFYSNDLRFVKQFGRFE